MPNLLDGILNIGLIGGNMLIYNSVSFVFKGFCSTTMQVRVYSFK